MSLEINCRKIRPIEILSLDREISDLKNLIDQDDINPFRKKKIKETIKKLQGKFNYLESEFQNQRIRKTALKYGIELDD